MMAGHGGARALRDPDQANAFKPKKSHNGSVDKLFAHHLSVRPLLNSYLAHVERTPVGMIDINAVDNERLVAGNHVGPHPVLTGQVA